MNERVEPEDATGERNNGVEEGIAAAQMRAFVREDQQTLESRVPGFEIPRQEDLRAEHAEQRGAAIGNCHAQHASRTGHLTEASEKCTLLGGKTGSEERCTQSPDCKSQCRPVDRRYSNGRWTSGEGGNGLRLERMAQRGHWLDDPGDRD